MNSLTSRSSWLLLLLLLLVANGLLIAGLTMPLMTIKTLLFLRNSFSVVSGIYDLWMGGKYWLCLLIAVFSVILPLLKVGILLVFIVRRIKNTPQNERMLRIMHDIGRWAMLDVFVVAVLIVTVKLGAFASVEIHPGMYVFCAAVLLIMVVTDLSVRLNRASKALA